MNLRSSAAANRIRLAIVSTHPIQYYAPVFAALAAGGAVQPRVFFTLSQSEHTAQFDPGFGRTIEWDIPLTDGYEHEFVPNVARHPSSARYGGIDNPELPARIEAFRPDAVLVYAWNARSHLKALRQFKGHVPVLFRGDSTLLDPRPPLRGLARRLFLRWVYSHVDHAIAVGLNNRDYFRWCGLPDKRIGIAPHSVDTRRFGDPDGEQDLAAREWRERLGIPHTARVVLFAAKLIARKEPLLLLDAFLRCAPAEAHCVIVGSGELEAAVRGRIADDERLHWLPFQNQRSMPAVYRVGDVFVMPSSRSETWGLALNEAMASGRPVIASHRVGAARDLVVEGVTGWMFRSGDLADLARALSIALSLDPDQLRKMGAAARGHVQGWSTEAAARGIERSVLAATLGAPASSHTSAPMNSRTRRQRTS